MPKQTYINIPVPRALLKDLVKSTIHTDVHFDNRGKLKFCLYCADLAGEGDYMDLMEEDVEEKIVRSVEMDDMKHLSQMKAALRGMLKKLEKFEASQR
jgi:hypothetical protein